jgi:hypothetical protein
MTLFLIFCSRLVLVHLHSLDCWAVLTLTRLIFGTQVLENVLIKYCPSCINLQPCPTCCSGNLDPSLSCYTALDSCSAPTRTHARTHARNARTRGCTHVDANTQQLRSDTPRTRGAARTRAPCGAAAGSGPLPPACQPALLHACQLTSPQRSPYPRLPTPSTAAATLPRKNAHSLSPVSKHARPYAIVPRVKPDCRSLQQSFESAFGPLPCTRSKWASIILSCWARRQPPAKQCS